MRNEKYVLKRFSNLVCSCSIWPENLSKTGSNSKRRHYDNTLWHIHHKLYTTISMQDCVYIGYVAQKLERLNDQIVHRHSKTCILIIHNHLIFWKDSGSIRFQILVDKRININKSIINHELILWTTFEPRSVRSPYVVIHRLHIDDFHLFNCFHHFNEAEKKNSNKQIFRTHSEIHRNVRHTIKRIKRYFR